MTHAVFLDGSETKINVQSACKKKAGIEIICATWIFENQMKKKMNEKK